MINKFRYKKPSNKDSVKDMASADTVSDNDTLKRIKSGLKDGKVKDTKDNDSLNRSTDSLKRNSRMIDDTNGVLDQQTKKELHELFSQLQFSTETALPPDTLRRALAESFFDQNRFQLGFMDDAAECFENMLLRIHTHIAQGEAEDMCSARHCIPHQKFAMTLVEQSVCASCGATSEPLSYTQMVHYVSTSTLVYQVRANGNRPNADPFGQLLRKAGNMGDVRTCPSVCGAVIQIGRTLMNRPEIVSIGLVWNSERPTLEHIMEVFSTIGTTLRLGDVFNTVVDSRWAEVSVHNLVGVVTYYGKHYSTFFFHTKLRVWIYFDDATVREVGPRWEQVVEKCRKGRYQPLLLLYALPDGTPVNTENAPKQITPLFADKVNKKPPQSVIRRSVTPSPEKPMIGTTRRAITPNPDGSAINQKPPLPRPYNDYQNLAVIQNNISQCQDADVVDGCVTRKDPEYVSRKSLDFGKPQVHRTLSNGSSSGMEGINIPDHLNVPRRRDSGNWSGDRNSASSASSTTMENPYLYLVGKVPSNGGSVPGSPTRIKSDYSSSSSGVYDAGYDSYSLSSNDSSTVTTLQHLMKMGHLAKIPEDYNNLSLNQNSPSCDVLCDEADELLVKSRQLEDEHDLVLALALCNAAATKARAAMNAPYNNPQTLTLARMKHNTCIMRARSLHRRMTQIPNPTSKDVPPEIRHTREGSSGSGRHSRQNSRDKSNHSRQNSRELLVPEKEKHQPTKSIEIYATLPKKKDALKAKLSNTTVEDEEYMLYDKPPVRESRSIFSRNKNKDQKGREKRSRSEDRNKLSRVDFSIAPEIINGKDTLKKAKEKEEDKKDKDGKAKKQHKIRRKLLMGGLIKRKNRSMPDLTDTTSEVETSAKAPTVSVDDSSVGLKGSLENPTTMNGYLSEGHLEFAGNNPNPNLERSKLMRKSFHGSAGKILTMAKVPPPPPLRTTSQLSTSKLNGAEVSEESQQQPQELYYHHQDYRYQAPVSLPYYKDGSFSDESFSNSSNTVITRADVHQESSPSYNGDSGVDEVDCHPTHTAAPSLELPPYPSPLGSAVHSRQASEDFPPPPSALDLSALDEHLQQIVQPSTLLTQLQSKRQQILSQDFEIRVADVAPKSSGETWLKELQAKQAALRNKKTQSDQQSEGIDVVNTLRYAPGENKQSVKDLASRFEASKLDPVKNDNNGVLSMKKRDEIESIAPEQIAEELREVEMLNAVVQKTLNQNSELGLNDDSRRRLSKKKSVSFCDQVILVATADEQEDDSFIPNPILERVLRTAMNKPETAAIRQEIISLRENELKKEESAVQSQPVYDRRPLNDVSKPVPEGYRQSPQPMLNQQPQSNHVQHHPVQSSPQLQRHPPSEMPQHLRTALPNHSQLHRQNSQNEPQLYRQNSQDDNLHIHRDNSHNDHPQVQRPIQNDHSQIQRHMQSDHSQIIQRQMPNDHLQVQRQIQNDHSQVQRPIQNDHSQVQRPVQNDHSQVQRPIQNDHSQVQRSIQNDHTQVQRQISHNILPQVQRQIVQSEHPQLHRQNSQNSPHNRSVYTAEPYHDNSHISYHYQQNGPEEQQYVSANAAQYSNPARQSPYQPIPPNSAAYAAYYSYNNSKSPQYAHAVRPGQRVTNPSPVNSHSAYQSPPLPQNYNQYPRNGYDQYYQRVPDNYPRYPNEAYSQNSPYQRVPPPSEHHSIYQRVPTEYDHQNGAYQRVPTDPYQRVPPYHPEEANKASPYQYVPQPKNLKKTVSFEPGTKGAESPTPWAVVTPIIVNNANNSIPTDKTKCNLCRKKNVVASNLYCQDCEFYMSRFKPKS